MSTYGLVTTDNPDNAPFNCSKTITDDKKKAKYLVHVEEYEKKT